MRSALIEIPIILGGLWLFCDFCVRRLDLPAAAPVRFMMGGIALVLRLGAETLLGLRLGHSISAQIAAYAAPDKLVWLATLIAFAAFPLAQKLMRRR
jgi:hypothetical protein